jgi:hypothetical protein
MAGIGVKKYSAGEDQRHKQQRGKEFDVVAAIALVLVRHDGDPWWMSVLRPTGAANPKFRKFGKRRTSGVRNRACVPRLGAKKA